MAFNVLIVDDSSSMRSILKKTLEISGFDVGQISEAGNGLEALDVLETEWMDVILTDVHMPEMDGFAFLEGLKKKDTASETPVVVVTTEGRQERIDELKQLGARACIQKPFKPEEIRSTLLQVLGMDEDALEETDMDGCDF